MINDFASLLQGTNALSPKDRLRFAAAIVGEVNDERVPLHQVLDANGHHRWPRVGGYTRSCQRTAEEREGLHRALQPLRTSEAAWIVALSSPGLRRLSADVGHPIHMITVIDKPDDWWLAYLQKANFWRRPVEWLTEIEKTADRWNYELLDPLAPSTVGMVDWVTVEDYGVKVELPSGMCRTVLRRHVRSILALCSLDTWQSKEEATSIKKEGKLRRFEELQNDQDGGRWELLQDLTLFEVDDGMPRLAYLVENVLVDFSEGRL